MTGSTTSYSPEINALLAVVVERHVFNGAVTKFWRVASSYVVTEMAPTLPNRSLLCVASACCTIACDLVLPPISNAPIIKKYEAAQCVPFQIRKWGPDTRVWESGLKLRDGTEILVKGAQMPGGRITVFYPAEGLEVVVANAGDYVYPSDVRFDLKNALLYVKAHGLAGGLSEQTWLFEYDVRGQRVLESRQIKNGILPPECEEPAHSR